MRDHYTTTPFPSKMLQNNPERPLFYSCLHLYKPMGSAMLGRFFGLKGCRVSSPRLDSSIAAIVFIFFYQRAEKLLYDGGYTHRQSEMYNLQSDRWCGAEASATSAHGIGSVRSERLLATTQRLSL